MIKQLSILFLSIGLTSAQSTKDQCQAGLCEETEVDLSATVYLQMSGINIIYVTPDQVHYQNMLSKINTTKKLYPTMLFIKNQMSQIIKHNPPNSRAKREKSLHKQCDKRFTPHKREYTLHSLQGICSFCVLSQKS